MKKFLSVALSMAIVLSLALPQHVIQAETEVSTSSGETTVTSSAVEPSSGTSATGESQETSLPESSTPEASGSSSEATSGEVSDAIPAAMGISPADAVMDGRVTIDIPDYSAATGWDIEVIKDVNVTANFADGTSSGKKITITLPEGMKFVSYPVVGTPAAGSLGYKLDATSTIAKFISGVTIPTKTWYNSWNGSLTYEITSNCEAITIPVQVAVDRAYHHEPTTLNQAVQATAEKEGSSLGSAAMDVVVPTTYAPGIWWNTTYYPTKVTVLEGDTDTVTFSPITGTTGYRAFKDVVFTLYYPIGATFVSVNAGTVLEVNDAAGYVKVSLGKRYSVDTSGLTVNVKTDQLAVGLYTAPQSHKIEVTHLDDAVTTITTTTKLQVDVKDSSAITNKLSISSANSSYISLSDDYVTTGPRFMVYNDIMTAKTGQIMEFSWTEGYYATLVRFPLSLVGSVEYKTSADDTLKTATAAQVITSGSTFFQITTASLGLAPGEYITYAKAKISDIAKGYRSGSSDLGGMTNNSMIIGKLKSGVDSSSVTLKTYVLDGSNQIDPATLTTATRTVTRPVATGITLNTGTTVISMTAGEKKTVTASIGPGSYYYQSQGAIVNPTAYIRVPKYTTISNVKVTGNGVVSYQVSSPYVSAQSGETFIEVTTVGRAGNWFDISSGYSMSLTFDLSAGLNANLIDTWNNYVFWTNQTATAYSGQYAQAGGVSDTLDVDNDGNLTEKLLPTYQSNFIINAKKELLIDTFIVPSGELSAKPPYDPASPSTAVPFTPSAEGNYSVSILNNQDNVAKDLLVYIPVPKENNNFGTQFQTTAFKWNMKLKAVPTLKVYSVDKVTGVETDITASKAANYSLSYSDNATTEANYAGATYTGSFSSAASMVKVENTAGMSANEKAVVEFIYTVDETAATVAANPAKLGSINDFRPYYYFKTVNAFDEVIGAGYQNGTRVGTILEVAEVGGIVYNDKNIDGIYNTGDVALSGQKVVLYKLTTAPSTYTKIAETNSAADGSYLFSGLSTGIYKVDFTAVAGIADASRQFTLQNKGTDESLDSEVDIIGANKGMILGVDATNSDAKKINAGVIDYTALAVSLNKATTSLPVTNAQTSPKETLTGTITPNYFDSIKAAADSAVWSSSDSSKVTVTQSGEIQGIAIGSATITYTIKDIYGNSASASCAVTVGSNDLPVITATDNQIIEYNSSFNPLTGVSATDTEDGDLTLTLSNVTQNTVNSGALSDTYQVTYQITDSQGNVATKTITVKVQDRTAPVVSATTNPVLLNTNSTAFKDLTEQSLYTLAALQAVDNYDGTQAANTANGSSAITFTSDFNKGILLPSQAGTEYTIQVVAKDSHNNTASAFALKVKVTDNTAPSFTGVNQSYEVDSAVTASAFEAAAVSGLSDDFDPVASVTVSSDFSTVVDLSVAGTYSVSVSARDTSGNTNTKTVSVLVRDTGAPVVTATTNPVLLNTNSSDFKTLTAKSLYALAGVTGTDSYDGVQAAADEASDSKITFTSNFAKSSYQPSQTGVNYNVLITAKDSSNNTSATYTLVINVIDNTAPSFTATAQDYEVNSTVTEAAFTASALSLVSDDFNTLADLTIVTDFTTAVDLSEVGDYTVTVTVTDKSGNETTKTVAVSVTDTTDPVITVTNTQVTFEVKSIQTEDDFLEAVGLTSMDNSQPSGTLTTTIDYSQALLDSIGGPKVVTITVVDESGNEATKEIELFVEDTTAPVLELVPTVSAEGITLEVNRDPAVSAEELISTAVMTATDNSGLEVVLSSDFDSSIAPNLGVVGTYTLTITGTDHAAGDAVPSSAFGISAASATNNSTSATVQIYIVDTIAPVLELGANSYTYKVNTAPTEETLIQDLQITATDNSGSYTITTDFADSVDVSKVGTYTVTVTATDGEGNSSQTTVEVVVVDTDAPDLVITNRLVNFEINALPVVTEETFKAAAIIVASDDSGLPVTITTDFADKVKLDEVGSYTVTVTATDDQGNQMISTVVVKIEDTVAPELVVAKENLTFTQKESKDLTENMILAAAGISATDNSKKDVAISLDLATAFKAGVPGEYSITVTATDIYGNVTTKTIKLVVKADPKTEVLGISKTGEIDQSYLLLLAGASVAAGIVILAVLRKRRKKHQA